MPSFETLSGYSLVRVTPQRNHPQKKPTTPNFSPNLSFRKNNSFLTFVHIARGYTLAERYIYGSSRLGVYEKQVDMLTTILPDETLHVAIANRNYEASNHLGNVLTHFRDVLLPIETNDGDEVTAYRVPYFSTMDYSAFGVQLDGRTQGDQGRFGFQGQESDNEIKGEGNSVNYKYRMHDPRVGRFFAVDPLAPKYPQWTPYQFSGNVVIMTRELEGLEPENNPNSDNFLARRGKSLIKSIADFAKRINIGKNRKNYYDQLEGHYEIADLNGLSEKTTETGNYVSDTDQESADRFNMYVNNDFVFVVDESNADKYVDFELLVVRRMLQGFVSGTGPENYYFEENGVISNIFWNSAIVKEALEKYENQKSGKTEQYSFGLGRLYDDFMENETIYSITGFVGSGTITITPTTKGLKVQIFNVTSLTSGTLGKELFNESKYPISYVRSSPTQTQDGELRQRVPFGNISQTYNLFIPFGGGGGTW